MVKLGVYFPFNRPLFARLGLAQLALQTRVPDYLSLCPNGSVASIFPDAYLDLLHVLEDRGVHWDYTPLEASKPLSACYRMALASLLCEDCTWFIKWDSDDFYSPRFLQTITNRIQFYEHRFEYFAYAVNDAILETETGETLVAHRVDWSKINRLGFASTCVAFNKRVATEYVAALYAQPALPDDVILGQVLKGKAGLIVAKPAGYTHVSHGQNESTKGWAHNRPQIFR